jgi:hypothetical protein
MHTPDTQSGRFSLSTVLCLAALLLACGCTSTPPAAWENTGVVDAPYNRVYEDVVEFVRTVDTNSHVDRLHGIIQVPDKFVLLEEFPFESYCEEPGVFHKWANRRVNTRYELRRVSEEKTAVAIASQFSAFSISENRWVAWRSNGKYEAMLLSQLRTRLQGRQGDAPQ